MDKLKRMARGVLAALGALFDITESWKWAREHWPRAWAIFVVQGGLVLAALKWLWSGLPPFGQVFLVVYGALLVVGFVVLLVVLRQRWFEYRERRSRVLPLVWVDRVTARRHVAGERPIFFLSVRNDATVPAIGVSVSAEFIVDRGCLERAKPKVVDIAAGDSKELRAESGITLSSNRLQRIVGGSAFAVVVHVTLKKTHPYSFEYPKGEWPDDAGNVELIPSEDRLELISGAIVEVPSAVTVTEANPPQIDTVRSAFQPPEIELSEAGDSEIIRSKPHTEAPPPQQVDGEDPGT